MTKKLYITEKQFNRLIETQSKKNTKSSKDINMDCIKANRKKRREEDREIYGDGFKQTTKVAKTEKAYSRKGKNKFKGNYFDDED
jgi:hypothetical protein